MISKSWGGKLGREESILKVTLEMMDRPDLSTLTLTIACRQCGWMIMTVPPIVVARLLFGSDCGGEVAG